MTMLDIKNLHATVADKEILKGINLKVNAGEVHAIMGPNGSGKSTLAQVLAGRESYAVTKGEVLYEGKNLLAMSPEERAREGIFLAFQYPIEIPGVANAYFLKASLNAIRKQKGLEELDAMDFLSMVKEKMKFLKIEESFLNRAVNEGFSGGEKIRNEILQMAVLDPKPPSWMKPTPTGYRFAQDRRRRVMLAAPIGPSWSPLPAPARHIVPTFTCPAHRHPGDRNWPGIWKAGATAGVEGKAPSELMNNFETIPGAIRRAGRMGESLRRSARIAAELGSNTSWEGATPPRLSHSQLLSAARAYSPNGLKIAGCPPCPAGCW